MPLEIQHTNEIQMPWTTWFAYGGMGAGKTTFASTFPAPLFIIPANEGSELALRAKKLDYVKVGKRADGKVVPVRQHLNEILTELEQRHARMRECLAKGDEAGADAAFPWQTLVPESLSHLGDMLIEDVSNYGKTKMDQQGWGQISTFMRTLHSRLRNLDAHIVYTALAKTETNDAGAIVNGLPALIGQTAEKLPSACDVVVYMEEQPVAKGEKPIYRAFFRRYRWWAARSRFSGFPDFLDNPSFSQLQPQLGDGA